MYSQPSPIPTSAAGTGFRLIRSTTVEPVSIAVSPAGARHVGGAAHHLAGSARHATRHVAGELTAWFATPLTMPSDCPAWLV